MAVCRAGLAVVVTGGLAGAGGTPWAIALVGVGLVVLAAGGWLVGRGGKRRR